MPHQAARAIRQKAHTGIIKIKEILPQRHGDAEVCF